MQWPVLVLALDRVKYSFGLSRKENEEMGKYAQLTLSHLEARILP